MCERDWKRDADRFDLFFSSSSSSFFFFFGPTAMLRSFVTAQQRRTCVAFLAFPPHYSLQGFFKIASSRGSQSDIFTLFQDPGVDLHQAFILVK